MRPGGQPGVRMPTKQLRDCNRVRRNLPGRNALEQGGAGPYPYATAGCLWFRIPCRVECALFCFGHLAGHAGTAMLWAIGYGVLARRCMSITRRAACCKLSHRFPGRLEQLADSRARAALRSGAGNALDVRSDGLEFLDDTLVAPVDVVDAVDNGFAFRDKSGEDEARAGTKIRSLDDGA